MKWTVSIWDYCPPPLNQLMRGKLRTRIRLEREVKDFIAAYCQLFDVPRATGRRRVSIRIVMPGRLMDPDAPLKGLLDALVACQRLLGDDGAHCEWLMPVVERGKRRLTEITLEEC